MNILDAINLLNENHFILESAKLNPLAAKTVGFNYEQNKLAYAKNGRDNSIFKDPEYYNDNEGIIWTYITKRDDTTLKLAFIDGTCDRSRSETLQNEYKSIQTENDLEQFLTKHEDILDSYNDAKRFIRKYLNATQKEKYQGRGIKVYRGLNLTIEEWQKIVGNNPPKNTQDLLDRIDNRTKQFNSFSIDPDISKSFAISRKDGSDTIERNLINIVFSGYAEPNDIYYAFTMYLMGRHGVRESELNINNRQKLKNLKIEFYRNPIEINKSYNKMASKSKEFTVNTVTPNNINTKINIVFDGNGLAGIKSNNFFKVTDICNVVGDENVGILIPNTAAEISYYILYNIKANRSKIINADAIIDDISKSKVTKIGNDYILEIATSNNNKEMFLFDNDVYDFIYYGTIYIDELPTLVLCKDKKCIVCLDSINTLNSGKLHDIDGDEYVIDIFGKTKYGPVITSIYNDIDIFEYTDEQLAEINYENKSSELKPYTLYKAIDEYFDFYGSRSKICIITSEK